METQEMLLTACLRSMVVSLPLIVVCLVGCIVIVSRRRSLGSAATPAICGTVLALLLHLASPVIWIIIPRVAGSGPNAGIVFSALSFLSGTAFAVAWGLVIAGVVLGRPRTAAPPAARL